MENILWKNEIRLVQELCTSFTCRDSMKLKFYMAKGEQNMLGQGFYKLKRGFWPWALIQKIGSRSLQTLSSLTLYGWSLSLTCQRGGKIHGTNEIRGRQTVWSI